MITAKMMWIADHPSDPWLAEYLQLQGCTVFKYGETKLVVKKPVEFSTNSSGPAEVKSREFDPQQSLIEHLANRVKE